MSDASETERLWATNAVLIIALQLARAEIDSTRRANEEMFSFAKANNFSDEPVHQRKAELDAIISKIDEGFAMVAEFQRPDDAVSH